MKKIVLSLVLALTCTKAYTYEPTFNAAQLAVRASKYGALVAGCTIGIWGVISLGPHLKVVGDGYDFLIRQIQAFTDKHPNLRKCGEYTLPVVALPVAYYLIRYSNTN